MTTSLTVVTLISLAAHLFWLYIFLTRTLCWQLMWERENLLSGRVVGITIMKWERPSKEIPNSGQTILILYFPFRKPRRAWERSQKDRLSAS